MYWKKVKVPYFHGTVPDVLDESPAIDTYEDHRMAMAFAPAALCNSALHIRNPHVVSKSYPPVLGRFTDGRFSYHPTLIWFIMWILVIILIGVVIFGLIAGFFYKRSIQKK